MAALRPVAPSSGGDDGGAVASVDHGFQGLYFALAAAALFSTCDACIKWLSSSFSLFQIIFFNALWSSIPLAVLIIRASGNGPWLYTRRMPRHLARVAFGALSALCAFYAFSKMPLADAYAIAFSGPLFITALAVPILGEQVGWRRWTAVTVGFIGVLVMLNPSNGTISLASLSVLFSAACYGFSATLLRSLCRTENTVLLLFIPNAIIVVVTGAIQPFVWVTPNIGNCCCCLWRDWSAALGSFARSWPSAARLPPPSPLSNIRKCFGRLPMAI